MAPPSDLILEKGLGVYNITLGDRLTVNNRLLNQRNSGKS